MTTTLTQTATTPIVWKSEESQKVFEWRVVNLVNLGYSYDDAIGIALTKLDWHDLARLIDRGCDPTTALRILV